MTVGSSIQRTFGTATLKDGEWQLEVEPHVAIKLKRVFSRIGKQFGVITIQDSDEVSRDLSWFCQRYPLVFDDASWAHLWDEADAFDKRTEDFAQVLVGTIQPRAFELTIPLREYQKVGAELALRSAGLLVADDVGLGKSALAIGTLTDPSTRPALIITLTHLPTQWQREIEKFAPGTTTHIIKAGHPYDLTPIDKKTGAPKPFPDVLITNYHKIAGWAETLAGHVKTIIFDEIQELRRSDSKKAAAARHLAEKATRRLGLSATPVYNYGGEMFNVFQVLRPGQLGSWAEFSQEWIGSYADQNKAIVKDPKALGTYLREQGMMIRRTREEVGRELPALIKIHHHVESDPEALESISKDVAELARLVLQEGVANTDRWEAAGELDWRLRQATGIAKAPYVADFVRMLHQGGGGKILLYGWHRSVYDIWLDKLKDLKPAMYTGSESPRQKLNAFEAFTKGDAQVLLMSLRAGAGLDGLQGSCNNVVFGELDWSPGVHEQAAGRVHRDGQKDSVAAYFLVSDSGSDPVVADVLGLKRQQSEGMRDPYGALIEKLDRGVDNIRRMATEYLRQRGESLAEPPPNQHVPVSAPP